MLLEEEGAHIPAVNQANHANVSFWHKPSQLWTQKGFIVTD